MWYETIFKSKNLIGINLTALKSFSSETSARYALALFEVSKESSQLQVIEDNLRMFLELYKKNADFKSFIQNPTKQISEQSLVLNKICEIVKSPKNLNNFFLLLIKKRRIFFLEKIIESFLKLVSIEKKELTASIVSSKELSQEEILKLNKELSSVLKYSINLDYSVDESLIGGFKIQIGSLMIDSSIKNKLKKYEKIMVEN